MTLLLTLLAVLTSLSFSTSTPVVPNSAIEPRGLELCPLDGLPCTESGRIVDPISPDPSSISETSSDYVVSSIVEISSTPEESSAFEEPSSSPSQTSTVKAPKPPRPSPPTAVPIFWPTTSASNSSTSRGPITPSTTTTLMVTVTQNMTTITVTQTEEESTPSPVFETIPTDTDAFSSWDGSESSWLYSPLPPTYTSEDLTYTSESTDDGTATSSPSSSPSITTKTSSNTNPSSPTTTPEPSTQDLTLPTLFPSNCTWTLTYTPPARTTSHASTYTVYTTTTTVRSYVPCGGCTNLAVITASPATEQPLTFTKVVTAASATWTVAFHCTTEGAETSVSHRYSTVASPFTTMTVSGL